MKKLAIVLFVSVFALGNFVAFAAEGLAEITARTEIERVLLRSLSKESFIVQVSGVYRTDNEKKLMESEIILRQAAYEKLLPPPELPGFDVEVTGSSEMTPSEYRKEIFRHSENHRLVKLNVQIFYDENLAPESVSRMKEAAQVYLSNQSEVKYALSFSPFAPRVETAAEESASQVPVERYILWTLLGLLVLLALIWLFMRLARQKPTTSESQSLLASTPMTLESLIKKTSKGGTMTRSGLLELFLTSPESFRSYFTHLSPQHRAALAKSVEGSAFDSMLSALSLETPDKDATEVDSQEELDVQFFANDFAEFQKTFNWQRTLFFGFLSQCPTEALITLFRESPPLVSAVVARFISADRVPKILAAISTSARREVIRNAPIAAGLPLEEITKIETAVREKLLITPSAGSLLTKTDINFLEEVVMNSDDQEQILADIRAVDPEAYQKLSKLRFNIEDIPTLPIPVVNKVMGELDNRQLALALMSLPEDIARYLLGLLPDNRRSLITSQRATLAGMPEQEVNKARQELASLFRKELS